LETANEERAEKVSRVKLVEKNKANLESSKLEAEAYIKQEREIIDKRSVLCQFLRSHGKDGAKDLDTKKEELENQLKAEKEKMTNHTEQLAEQDLLLKKERKNRDNIERDMLKAKSEFAVYERKDIKYREDINSKPKK